MGRVLRHPAEILRSGLEKHVEKLDNKRTDTLKVKRESEVARKYFGNLIRESAEGKRGVEDVDLEGGPAVPGGYGGEEIMV